MSNHAVPPPRRNGLAARRPSAAVKKTVPSENGGTTAAATGENATKPDFPTQASSKDVLMRVVAQNLSPELTLVEKVPLC
ncbi:hypothetical protein B296_00030879 [Ensete ventricosum]|uniref:Uncharacterized protein n=1 Tax=Ensete ventricosum TaxID=4639 RepID=A0A426YTQ9_ENSVE|nr:hypothetical protein B296_00030879 [Ensete ventricosum]